MINNEEIAEAYETLFTTDFQKRNPWSDFEYFWGTQVKTISIDVKVKPYIASFGGISETKVVITIIIEGREGDPDIYNWNICHYEIDGNWLINNFLKDGNDCWER
jgi:hypothetical protein